MKRPLERLSQRRLTAELRRALDLNRHDDVRRLARENPRGAASTHVRHNLGRARARALGQVIATDARSFTGLRGIMDALERGEPVYWWNPRTGIWELWNG